MMCGCDVRYITHGIVYPQTTLGGRRQYPYFTEEETEAQSKVKKLVHGLIQAK